MSLELQPSTVETVDTPPPALKTSRFSWRAISPLLVVTAALAVALTMWFADFQPVSSDTTKLYVGYEPTISDAELLNLDSKVWNTDAPNRISKETDTEGKQTGKLSTTVIPMSAQYIISQQGGSVLQATARALFNDKTMAVLVQWQDNSKNVMADFSKNQYSDSLALEFPVKLTTGHEPFRCMGQSDEEVNIWQWKAEREQSVAGDDRIYVGQGGKAVKNYLGPGVGYLKASPGVEADSNARYDEATKTWSVIFRRDLKVGDEKASTQFTQGQATLIAFAIWDGGAGERLSKKSVSTWVDFILQPGDGTPQTIVNLLTLSGVGLLMIVGIAVAWRVLPGGASGTPATNPATKENKAKK